MLALKIILALLGLVAMNWLFFGFWLRKCDRCGSRLTQDKFSPGWNHIMGISSHYTECKKCGHEKVRILDQKWSSRIMN